MTRIVDALLEQKNGPEVDEYRYFDPKLLRFNDSNSIPRATTPFNDAIVFIVGGGNYIEYHNLLDYAKVGSFPSLLVCYVYPYVHHVPINFA